MVDNRSVESRSALMSRIGPKDTAPERIVRSLLHRLGYRFRLYRKDLPGTPDVVLPSRKIAIFVHGCFWHGHGCRIGRPPKSRLEFWLPKLERTRARDRSQQDALSALGWRPIVIWQCETRDLPRLEQKLILELESRSALP